jgi:hypothetical protein
MQRVLAMLLCCQRYHSVPQYTTVYKSPVVEQSGITDEIGFRWIIYDLFYEKGSLYVKYGSGGAK